MKNLGDALREYRWGMRLTIRQMATKLGISAATLSRIENGEMPDGNTLRKILLWLMKA